MENNGKKPTFLEGIFSWVGKVLSKLSKVIDKIVFNKTGSLLLTLSLALGICYFIDYDAMKMELMSDSLTTSTISNASVNLLYDEDEYLIQGVPETVSVTLSGNSSDVQKFRQQNQVTVTADLRSEGEGTKSVQFQVEDLPDNITATVIPDSVQIEIEKKVSKTFTVTPILMLGSDQEETDFDTPVLKKTTVTITGTQTQIDTIRSVRAIVDASEYTKDFETDATVVAYDSTGNQVSVTIKPATIHATVKLATGTQ